jgi:uncharacterized membrane protein YphA (DoxX/SURF4 family)
MTMILLIVKIVLALLFGLAGIMKATRSMEQLAGAGMTWVNEYPETSVRLVGILELIGALGIILPTLTGFMPVSSLICSLCLAVVMVLAAVHHYKHKEFKNIAINVVLFALCAFVAYNSL